MGAKGGRRACVKEIMAQIEQLNIWMRASFASDSLPFGCVHTFKIPPKCRVHTFIHSASS